MVVGSELQKKIFFVPYWVKKALDRQGESLATVQDLNHLSEILSCEDLACMAKINSCTQEYFGFSNMGQDTVFLTWNRPNFADKYYQQVEPLFPMVVPTLANRLFSEQALEERYPNPYEIIDVERDTVVVLVYPGHFAGTNLKTNQIKLIRDLAKLMYSYGGYDRMANRGLFETYIDSLV